MDILNRHEFTLVFRVDSAQDEYPKIIEQINALEHASIKPAGEDCLGVIVRFDLEASCKAAAIASALEMVQPYLSLDNLLQPIKTELKDGIRRYNAHLEHRTGDLVLRKLWSRHYHARKPVALSSKVASKVAARNGVLINHTAQ